MHFPLVSMVHLRDLVFFTLLLSCVARHSMRIGGFHYDAQQQANTFTKAIDALAGAREALLPQLFRKSLSSRRDPQAAVLYGTNAQGLQLRDPQPRTQFRGHGYGDEMETSISRTMGTRRCVPPIMIGTATYQCRLLKPLGIIFEEVNCGKPEGVVVAGIVEGGNADLDGRILVGDKLLKVSAVEFGGQESLVKLGGGAQFTAVRRNMIPVSALPFDVIMNAIASNQGRWGYTDVALELQHTDQSVPRARPARATERTDDATVTWDGLRGTTVDGVSTPIRPGPDNF